MKLKRLRYTIAILLFLSYICKDMYDKYTINPIAVQKKFSKAFKNFSINRERFAGNQKYIWILDAGHGYRNNKCGYKSVPDYLDKIDSCFYEFEFNYSVRHYLAEMLDSVGIKYTLMGRQHYDIPLSERIKEIESHMKFYSPSKKPTVLMSIHANAHRGDNPNTHIEGFEVYSQKNSSRVSNKSLMQKDKQIMSDSIASILAQILKHNFPKSTLRKSVPTRYNRTRNFAIISKVPCYAILAENNFFTNPVVREKMKTKDYQKQVAYAYFLSILTFEERIKLKKD